MKLIRFIKISLFLIFMTSVIVLINTLSGSVHFVVNNHGIEMPISYFLIVILIFSTILIAFYNLWKIVWAIPERYQHYLLKKRQLKAQNLILDSFSALAAEQPQEAQNAATLASHLDPNNPIILLLESKAAYATQDFEKAITLFHKMLKEPRLKFLGLYGLARDYKKKKDYLKVNELLSIAIKNRHDSPWVLNELLENDLRLIKDGYKSCGEKGPYYKLLSSEEYAKHLSLEYMLLAKKQITLHDYEGARESLIKSLNENPGFLGAALELATLSQHKKKDTKVFKLLLKTAKINPHPTLLNYLLTFGGYDSPTIAYQFLSEQLSHNQFEVLLFLSQVSARAFLWDIAKQFVEQAIALNPTNRTKMQLNLVLRGLNVDASTVNHPVLKEDYRWICMTCYREQEHFHVFCPHCDSVNKIDYSNLTIKKIKMEGNDMFLLTGS